MNNTITLSGRIVFDPKDRTVKHQKQSSWKKIAMIIIKDDIVDYYAWFLKKRYGIVLNSPLRGAHISFINDSIRDFNGGFYNPSKAGSVKERELLWSKVKKKYNNTKIDITLSVDVRSNGEHWWLTVPHENRDELYKIRTELGLPRPNLGKDKSGNLKPLGIHMTIGYPVDGRVDDETFEGNVQKAGRMNLEHSKYIHKLIQKGLVD